MTPPPFSPTLATPPRPVVMLDRVWLARVARVARLDDDERRASDAPWSGPRADDWPIAAAVVRMRGASTAAERWAGSDAWSRAVQAQADAIADEIRAERPTVAVLRAVLARGTDADLTWLAGQTGGVPAGGRVELVAGLAMRAAAIAHGRG